MAIFASVRFSLLKNNKILRFGLLNSNNVRLGVAGYSSKNDDDFSEQDIDQIRNISGLPTDLRSRTKHVDQLPNSFFQTAYKDILAERDEQRKAYAMFGTKSGIHPGTMWDTQEEYREHLTQDLMRQSLEEAVRMAIRRQTLEAEQKADTIQNIKVRVEEILPDMLEEYGRKGSKMKSRLQDSIGRRRSKYSDKYIAEAQEYLGYDVSPTHPEYKALKSQIKDKIKLSKKSSKSSVRKELLKKVAAGEKAKAETSSMQDIS